MDDPNFIYLVPRVASVETIFGKVFFADLVALDDAVGPYAAQAVKRIGPFSNAGDAHGSAMRMYWAQFAEW
ncbi:hypothetical protein ABIE56_002395 [Luteibacter sp. 621]|uniref:hypothetical protein n=1 Tax=Luteibacter sp. 621 TaxID=3373916 RepID=UPI003D1FDE3A